MGRKNAEMMLVVLMVTKGTHTRPLHMIRVSLDSKMKTSLELRELARGWTCKDTKCGLTPLIHLLIDAYLRQARKEAKTVTSRHV